MDKLPTTNLTGIEIFEVGTWNGDQYHLSDLQAMVDAFTLVGFEPPVKAGHQNGQEDATQAKLVFGEPALGYIKRIYIKGTKLLADITGIPARFAKLIDAGAFRRISSEIFWNYLDENSGKVFPRVLKAIAFLGADIPALTSLKAIESLFNKNATGALFAFENSHEYRLYEHEYHCDGMMGGGLSMADYLVTYPRLPKEDAAYDPDYDDQDERCGNCLFFLPGMNACTLVEGRIDYSAYCENFKIHPSLATQMAKSGRTKLMKQYIIEKREDKWCLISHEGETLGCHDTRGEAEAQEKAVKANMAKSKNDVKLYKIEERDDGWYLVMGDKEYGPYDSREDAQKKHDELKADMSKQPTNQGGIDMDQKEFQQKLDEQAKQIRDGLLKEFDQKIAAAKEEGKQESAKDAETLRAEVRKLQADKDAQAVESWIKTERAAGRLAPVEETRVRSLLSYLPAEGVTISFFSGEGEKRTEAKESPRAVLMSIIEKRPSIFKSLSNQGGSPTEPERDGRYQRDYSNAGAETDERAKGYLKKNNLGMEKYAEACSAVWSEDPQLKTDYERESKGSQH